MLSPPALSLFLYAPGYHYHFLFLFHNIIIELLHCNSSTGSFFYVKFRPWFFFLLQTGVVLKLFLNFESRVLYSIKKSVEA